jgi:hypothetical protein
MRLASLSCVVLAACGTSDGAMTRESGVNAVECQAQPPASTHGLIGESIVTLDVTGETFTTTFTHEDVTHTSSGDVTFPAAYSIHMTIMTTSDLDVPCIGQEVIYSYSWSDDCTFIGLSRDTEMCETRITNLDGVTLYQK